MLVKLSMQQLRRIAKDIDGVHKAVTMHYGLSKAALIFYWLALGVAVVIFFVKVSDTSSWALQYDTQTQESVGYWVIGLGAGFCLCLFAAVWYAAEGKALQTIAEEWAASLQEELAQVTVASEKPGLDDAEKTELLVRKNEIEGHLRKLEAT